jgi:hypothetical protein
MKWIVDNIGSTFDFRLRVMSSATALLLKEIEEAQREVAEARHQFSLAQENLTKARQDHAKAEANKQRHASDVDKLAVRLDNALAVAVHAPEYIVEFQANIGCYQCYIHIDVTKVDAKPVLAVNTKSHEVELRLEERCLFQVTLQHEIEGKDSHIRIQKDHIHIRLPLTDAAKENRKAAMTAGMAARIVPTAETTVEMTNCTG